MPSNEDKLLEKIQELIYDVKMVVMFTILDFIILTFLFIGYFGEKLLFR